MGSDAKPQKGSGMPPFLAKTYDLVDDSSSDDIVSWSSMGSSFIIWNPTDFSRDLLPKYFKHNNFSSFVRQLNTYGFRKLCPDQWEFATEGFIKGERDAMKIIRRRKPLASSNSSCQAQDDAEHQLVQAEHPMCTIAAHQELEGTVEKLQQEKKELLHQLSKLQLEQQATKSNLAELRDRLLVTDDRQRQLVSFYARFSSPSFSAQFAQRPPPSESDLLLTLNKKRRLTASEQVLVGREDHKEALAGTGDSGDGHESIVHETEDAPLAEGFSSRQLCLGLPSDRLLEGSPSSLSSDVCPKEAQALTDYVERVEHLVATREHNLILPGGSQHLAQTGESGVDDTHFSRAADKQAPGGISWIIPKLATPAADKPCEGVVRELSLRPSNQTLGTSPMSLGSITLNRESQTPLGCLESSANEVCLGQTGTGTASTSTTRQIDEVSNVQTGDSTIYATCTRRLGDDRVALSKHLRGRLRTVVSSTSKPLRAKATKSMADRCGSNDGFWEKYLTESPCSTDSEPDSESNDDGDSAIPRERQFL